MVSRLHHQGTSRLWRRQLMRGRGRRLSSQLSTMQVVYVCLKGYPGGKLTLIKWCVIVVRVDPGVCQSDDIACGSIGDGTREFTLVPE
jgi:hypothetical protein